MESKKTPPETNPSESPPSSRSPGTSHAAKGWHHRGYLPHCDAAGLTQGITFRLHDAVPESVIKAWKQELEWLEDQDDSSAEKWEAQRRELQSRLAAYEDAGYGDCHLGIPAIAALVQDALLYFDGCRYDLCAWCIMPNHVHVLIRTRLGWPVGHIVQSWKRHTTREANRILHRRGNFWALDYHDRYIRNEAHFLNAVEYIHENPVKAGLCTTAADWKWGSASNGIPKLDYVPADWKMP